MNDPVNRPKHYTSRDIEVIDIIEAWDMNFRLGNVIKYVLRHKEKNGIEDLKKARWYLDREIAKAEKMNYTKIASSGHWCSDRNCWSCALAINHIRSRYPANFVKPLPMYPTFVGLLKQVTSK